MQQEPKNKQIIKTLSQKACLKQTVFDNTLTSFRNLKIVLQELEAEYNTKLQKLNRKIQIQYKDRGAFQCEFRIAGDLIIFHMHSNIFEFDRDHSIWKNSIAQKDKNSTYCGILSIYNFLADSFKFNRPDDLGYLIARVFINKDFHYFVEGKRQMSYLYNRFGVDKIDREAIRNIIESGILYALQFDLLVPPYDDVKIITVDQINEKRKKSAMQTGKRLGFTFRTDDIHGEKIDYTGG